MNQMVGGRGMTLQHVCQLNQLCLPSVSMGMTSLLAQVLRFPVEGRGGTGRC